MEHILVRALGILFSMVHTMTVRLTVLTKSITEFLEGFVFASFDIPIH